MYRRVIVTTTVYYIEGKKEVFLRGGKTPSSLARATLQSFAAMRFFCAAPAALCGCLPFSARLTQIIHIMSARAAGTGPQKRGEQRSEHRRVVTRLAAPRLCGKESLIGLSENRRLLPWWKSDRRDTSFAANGSPDATGSVA